MRCLLPEHRVVLGLRFCPRDLTDMTGGTFRLLRLVTQLEHILRLSERRTVTSEVVATSCSSVVIGAPACGL